ncbi:MAG: 16S rRNA (cytidine(1402)-2'-O)-methyltransferase, partial [Planctomycetota bacterium]
LSLPATKQTLNLICFSMSNGILYLVATPIGNLEDMTLRAIRILKEIDIIACEDTRITANLLNHYQIKKPLVSYFEHNENQRSKYIVENLMAGKNVALVSNAGTPLISDPGYELVNLCILNNICVKAIPGACALNSALSISGLPTDRFIFEGFLPRKTSKRKKRLQSIAKDERTVIIYESPYRLHKLLSELREICSNRQIVVVREMTKFYEEIKRGSIEDIIKDISGKRIKGEITLIIKGVDS